MSGGDVVPKVSIGLITYNQVAIAPDAVRSALAQDWPNLEVVVSDDASTDGTAEALLALAATDPRLKVLANPKNLGITGNANRMLAACTGEYLAAIGGDDQIHPDRTRRQVERLEADPTLAAVATGTADFDLDPARPLAFRDPVAKLGRDRATLRDLARTGNRISPSPAWMYRARCAPKAFDPRVPKASDGMFNFETLRHGDLGLIADPLTYYRVSPGSAVGKGLGWEPLLVFTLWEALEPHLLPELRSARAAEYAGLARRAQRAGERERARALYAESLRQRPGLRTAAKYASTWLPSGVLERWIARR